ncbi:MAG: TonB-dependent receptor [Sphingopyxis sp.]|nr:TonB-dependent receptor [Sphingopyxis sp.]
MRATSITRSMLALGVCSLAMTAAPAVAQDSAAPAAEEDKDNEILVTGSRIKRDPKDSSVPLEVITMKDLERESISNPEQFVQYLASSGTGPENLASNSDVVSGQQRGNNGSSTANLRGQGSNGTLVMLNGRRVAAHGLNGGSVDVNQIPFAALERVEVLKDGASAIYGTDAIGGVINFITRNDYEGVTMNAFYDITEEGDSPLYRVSALAGYGDLGDQGFNIMASVSYEKRSALRGSQRDFVNTFQPDRGLSVDTRGTPFATFIPLAGTAYTTATAPFIPGSTTTRLTGGINILDLPGQAGCGAIDGQAPYDPVLWAFPEAQFACAWDTGRAAVLQQPIDTLTWFGRGVVNLGDHQLSVEVTGSDASSAKRFSNLQLTPNTTSQNYAYRRIAGVNDAIFDDLANRLTAAFPTFSPLLAATPALSYRWRCIECGVREIETETQTQRYFIGAEGPIFKGWDYSVGASLAQSEAQSTLGSGYYFRGTLGNGAPDPNAPTAPGATQPGIIGVLNSGRLNPFLLPGQQQSQQAIDMLRAVSAEGTVLYGGRFRVTQLDASLAGDLFELPGGTVKAALGIDYRRETYRFNGDVRAAAARPTIIAAPFDDGNALTGVKREIKAAFAELLVPVFDQLELSFAARIDDYRGLGSTTNPKISAKFRPTDWLMLRGSYNTGFRVPSFNQIFNGVTLALYSGRDIADPRTCPGGVPNAAQAGCAALTTLQIANGGRPNLRPETSEQMSLGIVLEPTSNISFTADWWTINRDDTIQTLSLRQLVDNFSFFEERFIRGAGGQLDVIDQTWVNAGSTRTQGIDIAARGRFDLGGGALTAGVDGTYLLKKEERVTPTAPFGNLRGVFSFANDLGIKWKHNAYVTWSNDDWAFSLSQIFRGGYRNQQLPGVANGTVNPPNDVIKTDDYVIYNASASFTGAPGFRFTIGVKNLFDKDPPFAVTYDSASGAGSSWEPRVADPRGRAFTFQVEKRF